MNVTKRSVARLATRPAAATWLDTVCHSCRVRLSHRSRFASTNATATASRELQNYPPPSSTSASDSQHAASTGPITTYAVRTGVVLSRAPMLTRDLTAFEKAYYLYQRRLNERLALPFTRYFYYKRGTPAEDEWKRKARARRSAARDIGDYSAYGPEGWADEVLVGDDVGEPARQIEAIINDAEGKGLKGEELPDLIRKGEDAVEARRRRDSVEKIEIVRPSPRRTHADESGDRRSLDRSLDRTVYLLVETVDGRWRFPEDVVRGREGLHDAAERILVQAGGLNMNTWVVGNAPIGHYEFDYPKPVRRLPEPETPAASEDVGSPETKAGTVGRRQTTEVGEKVFFMKARIMAGRPDLSKNEFGHRDFCWLAREEVEKVVTPRYWASIRGMLAER